MRHILGIPAVRRARDLAGEVPGPPDPAREPQFAIRGWIGDPPYKMASAIANPTGLVGRNEECRAVEQVLDDARTGRSAVLVIRGEPGIGKSALLDHASGRASDFRVCHAAGVESEAELALSGVQQLLGASVLGRTEALPPPQRDALKAAFGLVDAPPSDIFLVALAVLSIVADIAEERPLLLVVDDVQWLDRASVQVLSFLARRLVADRVAMLFALRRRSVEPSLVGLPEMSLEGLADHHARLLLDAAVPGGMDEQVRDRIVAETRGNPLALRELPRAFTPGELAGGFGLPGGATLTSHLQQSFVRRIEALPSDTRMLLLVAAAEPVGNVMLLLRAGAGLGIANDALAAAQDAGLVELGQRVRFRHPLVRSAAYRAAAPAERRRAHGALADATDSQTDPDRRAWHRSRALAVPEESVAADLELSASRARTRGGAAAAAAFLQRAAELTPEPVRRGERALAAAHANFDAGALDTAEALLATAGMSPLDELQRAHVDRLRARIAFARTRGKDTPALLSAAAIRLEPLEPDLARETHLEALWAAVRSGRFARPEGIVEAARAAASTTDASSRAIDLLLDGLTTRMTHGYVPALPSISRALEAFLHEGFRRENLTWCWLACQLAMDLWRDDACEAIASGLTDVTRQSGALGVLPFALSYSAAHRLFAGEFDLAEQLVQEARAITTATSSTPIADFSVLLAAWRGDRDRTYAAHAAVLADATARGEGFAVEVCEWAVATLHLGLREYPEAQAAAQRAYDDDGLGFNVWVLPELIEAAARNGDERVAAAAVERLIERSGPSDASWARGIEARSRALVADSETAEALYVEAIDHLSRSRVLVHLARAQLIYGEWLRRENRRVDARMQLKAAHAALEKMGAGAFAERALSELVATGERVRKRTVVTRDELTPQEAQIARLAAAGQSNPEIGAQLFLSRRTVEWHLRKVFTKLGINSRTGLAEALGDLHREAVAT